MEKQLFQCFVKKMFIFFYLTFHQWGLVFYRHTLAHEEKLGKSLALPDGIIDNYIVENWDW